MLQTSQESSPKRVTTTKIWYWLQKSFVLNISKIAKLFKFGNPNSVNVKEFINLCDKAFYAYWQSIHSMLKAVVYDVNCTSDAHKISFNVILNFVEYIIMSSSFNIAKVTVAIVRTKFNQFIPKFCLV